MKFEYRIQPLLYRALELEQKLNEAGSQGWEAVGAIECQGKYQVLLKRAETWIAPQVNPNDWAPRETEATDSEGLSESIAAIRKKGGWTPERRAAQSEAMRQRHAKKRKRAT